MSESQQTADDACQRAMSGLDDRENLSAYAEIPGGSLIRIVGAPNEGTGAVSWTERIEVGAPGDWTVYFQGDGLAPTSKYNQLIDDLGAT